MFTLVHLWALRTTVATKKNGLLPRLISHNEPGASALLESICMNPDDVLDHKTTDVDIGMKAMVFALH